MTRLGVVIVSLGAFLASVGPVPAAQIIDQQQQQGLAEIGTSGNNAGQSFTPTLAGIDFAIFFIDADGGQNADGSLLTLRVDLFEGNGFGGTLLASTAPLVVTTNSFQPIEFNFPTTVALTPGNVYSLQVVSGAGVGIVGFDMLIFLNDGLPGGTAFNQFGVPFPAADWVFAEGINVAVSGPSTFALLGLGALGLLRYEWRRRKQTKHRK